MSEPQRWPVPEARSALVVLVPEAEGLVGPLRAAHDPSAAAGVPAHITILYPFMPPGGIDMGVGESLRSLLARFLPFRFTLAEVRRFPGVVYLAPEPADPLVRLTEAVHERFPAFRPYEGRYPEIVPHLSVAVTADEAVLDEVAARLAAAALPLAAHVTAVALLDNQPGRWRVVETFAFSG